MDKTQNILDKFVVLNKALSEVISLTQKDLVNYRTYQSEESQLIFRIEEWKRKNEEAEGQFRKTVEATRTVENQNRKLDEELNANRNALWVKAHTKFKEVEKMIDEADKSRIKKAMKELEAVAA